MCVRWFRRSEPNPNELVECVCVLTHLTVNSRVNCALPYERSSHMRRLPYEKLPYEKAPIYMKVKVALVLVAQQCSHKSEPLMEHE